jgi:hypothetical protein
MQSNCSTIWNGKRRFISVIKQVYQLIINYLEYSACQIKQSVRPHCQNDTSIHALTDDLMGKKYSSLICYRWFHKTTFIRLWMKIEGFVENHNLMCEVHHQYQIGLTSWNWWMPWLNGICDRIRSMLVFKCSMIENAHCNELMCV